MMELKRPSYHAIALTLGFLFACLLAAHARAQQQEPEDPEDEKQFGLWLDQGISTPFSGGRSLEVEFHERLDENASNLYEYFVQGGLAFRPKSWLLLLPSYRYQRFPGNPATTYENRLLFNTTLSKPRGPWRYTLRTLVEGRFPDDRPASARLRFRPLVEYTLPPRVKLRPVIGVSNEFFLVPWTNPYANGGTAFTQNRFQVGIRLPINNSLSIRPYWMLQSVNLPPGWDTNEIFGLSLGFKVPRKTS